ncbi:MAG: undecaprenyl/decaprenyl-phosphate alpha-N-acetylglucosaminyl 1-phosphate transferase [Treponema sp.]|jgi:UDP-GlcNAc:undecaprenyl-phosphate GlcNAc-1-phosphate transferase|nr:undecaprenyl/decaprenyl-phosphate alpha-N-acetylglucosaminyl 1-phosphate transferase [Treponema sp.]
MALIILTPVVSFVLSLFAVALVLRMCRQNAWYDRINERKIHSGDIPRLGGAGFAPAYILASLFVLLGPKTGGPASGGAFFFPLGGMILILVFGVVDDFHPLMPRIKILIQTAAAFCVVVPGYTFESLFAPPRSFALASLPWIGFILSIFWVVGLINAINLIDGIDGLAGGISFLAALSYGLAFFLLSDPGPSLLLCLCLAAVILGFLVFNVPLPRARIFMGDGGSQFLGFMLALLPMMGGKNPIPLAHAAAFLLIPILDTTAAVWRRLRDGRRIDSPDKLHIHHKLLNLGLNSRRVDGLLFAVQILLSALTLFSLKARGALSFVSLVCAYLAGCGFFIAVHFFNRRLVKVRGTAEKSGTSRPV